MLNLSVMITAKMRRKIFDNGYTECFLLIPSKIITKKFPLVAKRTVHDKSRCIIRFYVFE